MKIKKRLDSYLVQANIVENRSQARSVILSGRVLVNKAVVDKAGFFVSETDEVSVIGPAKPYVSRGGEKIAAAYSTFGLDFSGLTIMDVGASTGGFTDFALKNGAKKVFAIDVGYGQFAWSLRQNPNVVILERTNIRNIDANLIPDSIDAALIDVSFISLEKVIDPILPLLAKPALILALIKPQFEAGKQYVGKGGVVKDSAVHASVITKIWAKLDECGLQVKGLTPSPIRGPKGNIEFFIYAVNEGEPIPPDEQLIARIVERGGKI